MNEIKCPKCGTTISVDGAEYAAILSQVRTQEFDDEVNRRLVEIQNVRKAEEESRVAGIEASHKEAISQKDLEIHALRQKLASSEEARKADVENARLGVRNEAARELSQKELEIERLRQQVASMEENRKTDIENARLGARNDAAQELSQKELEIERLRQQVASLERSKALEVDAARLKAEQQTAEVLNRKENELRAKEEEISRLVTENASERKNAAERIQSLMDTHKAEADGLRNEIELYKNFRSRRSVKLLGEDLEQHCYMLYNQVLLPVMPNATLEKDNTVVREDGETKGTKGDFIFRDSADGVEYVSIMFEMKNESDVSVNRHRNADFFEKLDKDRTKKGCEFAVLVSMLEMDNDVYNNGIVAVPGYDKMYVVRPDNFIPIITLLVQTSRKALAYKKELAVAKSQSVDVTHFEETLDAFREGFARNVVNAKKKYDEAIKGIDTTIATLAKIKESLQVSAGHLSAANNKVDGLTIKRLTRGNSTMEEAFADARRKREEEEGPENQEAD